MFGSFNCSIEIEIDSVNFNICVCYLPPLNSLRQIDAQKIYDCPLAKIYEYPYHGLTFISSRCGDMADFIEGIDDLGYRETIDFNVNKYGHLLIEFLLNSNILRGTRNLSFVLRRSLRQFGFLL